ncbi:Uncharacterized membrane protein YpjA [Seinonella peptonophila]|uniref:Uncharacterized membrane protein YpjA n=1 Tax=Seinonella peptonophila TaxID=112248 RepID=A0A1M4TE13_9BACL|nr:DUF1405 domain-containing protein [Seinonella peptonophila]SHE42683.1 Uncharacterized membrane protein YpjA [Seinonella peptonophila]
MFLFIKKILMQRWFLITLFIVNFLGTIYGFYWYKNQLAVTPPQWLIFVPDSPTASAFFTVVLWLFIMGRHHKWLEAFAAITLFKYGIWAVVMIIWGGILDPRPFTDALVWEQYMLIVSHLGMSVQALLYIPFYRFTNREIVGVSIWTLLNDFLDYTINIHPWLTAQLEQIPQVVGSFTLFLSLITITIFTITTRFQQQREVEQNLLHP